MRPEPIPAVPSKKAMTIPNVPWKHDAKFILWCENPQILENIEQYLEILS